MRLRHPDGSTLHLCYCSNVHPADDLEGVAVQLERYAARVRERLDVPVLGVGLWVGAPAVADAAAADRLRAQLDRLGLEVVTLNGFPYRGFHDPVVKRQVYRPNWAAGARLDYTVALAGLLARLLPDDVTEGSISTLPLGWRSECNVADRAVCRHALERLAVALAALEDETGKRIRIALEPEPGCTIETIAQASAFLAGLAPEWIGVCVDACHLAVQFEAPREAVARLAQDGVAVVKAQVSSALRVPHPRGEDEVGAFAEPRFLHQTRELVDGRVVGVDDLAAALGGELPGDSEWRVHFHVPVHADGPRTTQTELSATLAALVGGSAAVTTHLEVETYTWTVLPEAQRPRDDEGLVQGLARELEWTRDRLVELGLEEET